MFTLILLFIVTLVICLQFAYCMSGGCQGCEDKGGKRKRVFWIGAGVIAIQTQEAEVC